MPYRFSAPATSKYAAKCKLRLANCGRLDGDWPWVGPEEMECVAKRIYISLIAFCFVAKFIRASDFRQRKQSAFSNVASCRGGLILGWKSEIEETGLNVFSDRRH